jgi:protein SCO1/2
MFLCFPADKREVKVQPIFISVDPSRDTVGQLRYYAQDFHKDFIYLTGTKDQVAKAARAYRVYFSKVKSKSIFPLLTLILTSS